MVGNIATRGKLIVEEANTQHNFNKKSLKPKPHCKWLVGSKVLKPDVDLSGQDLFVGSTDNSLMQQHLG
jgi:hypothetical protein